jgi:hypothetical protein
MQLAGAQARVPTWPFPRRYVIPWSVFDAKNCRIRGNAAIANPGKCGLNALHVPEWADLEPGRANFINVLTDFSSKREP